MAQRSDDEVEAAADLLIGLRNGHGSARWLPPELTPETAEDTQRIIDAVGARVERQVAGWKSYLLYKPMVPPMLAPIYDRFPSGVDIPSALSSMRLIEPEIMFRLDQDLPARDRNYSADEVMEVVTAVVAFEVIGSRFRAADPQDTSSGEPGGGSLFGALADHLANAGIVVGDEIPGWRDVAFEDVSLRLFEGERELISVTGCHPFDNPFYPVVIAVNRLRRRGGARAGETIATNSSTSFVAVSADSEIRATYDGLGEVTATFRD